MKVIAVASQKGGVGKTSTCVNLGCRLAMDGLNVLILDLEPQAQAGSALGINLTSESDSVHSLGLALSDALGRVERKALRDIMFDRSELVEEFGGGRLCLLASEEATMTMAQNAFVTVPFTMTPVLRRMLVKEFSEDFDYILIDTPPAVSSLNAVGMAAADFVLSLVNPEYPTVKGAMILKEAVQAVESLTRGECTPRFLGAFMNRSNPESSWTVEDVNILGLMINSGLYPYVTDVRRDRRISRAYFDGKPAVLQHPNHSCGKQYTELLQEILDRTTTPEEQWPIAEMPGAEEETEEEAEDA
ncbi:ParA family protein [Streptomyces sp. NPDC051662]|uniref:ParA family protein n=1 Tax=Streptomyces sp. NPDC051662 TaxID=3154750 RepID=UPI0034240AF1